MVTPLELISNAGAGVATIANAIFYRVDRFLGVYGDSDRVANRERFAPDDDVPGYAPLDSSKLVDGHAVSHH
jgi:hypothetical protein